MDNDRFSEHFRQFAASLKAARECFGVKEGADFLRVQNEQVDRLVELEKQFKETLVAHRWGPSVFKDFVDFICVERRNILDARPYFRERQAYFTQHISVAFHNRDSVALYECRFNHRFVQFVLERRAWAPKSRIRQLANEITAIRQELVVMNMPLAISRARIFYSRTPKSHLSYMDLIQIACEGLISAIDKFVPPFSKAFRSTAMGRMTGNFIENYSETLIHFFPTDKRRIYRANKLIGRQGKDVEVGSITEAVNNGIDTKHQTNDAEISELLAAARTVSADTPIGDDESEVVTAVDRHAAPISWQPDYSYEQTQLHAAMNAAIDKLSCNKKKKLLKMKGLNDVIKKPE